MDRKTWFELICDTISFLLDTVSYEVSNLHNLKKRSSEIGLYLDIKYSGRRPHCIHARTYFEGNRLYIEERIDRHSDIEIRGSGLITQDTDDRFSSDITFYVDKRKMSGEDIGLILKYGDTMDIWGAVDQNLFLNRHGDNRIYGENYKNFINPGSKIEDIIQMILKNSRDIIMKEEPNFYMITNVKYYDMMGRYMLMEWRDPTALVLHSIT